MLLLQGPQSQHHPAIDAQHQTLQQALLLLGARQQAVQQALAAVQAGTLLPQPGIDGAAAPSHMSVSVPELGGSTQDALQRLAASLLLPALASGAVATPQLPQEHQELRKQQQPPTWQQSAGALWHFCTLVARIATVCAATPAEGSTNDCAPAAQPSDRPFKSLRMVESSRPCPWQQAVLVEALRSCCNDMLQGQLIQTIRP